METLSKELLQSHVDRGRWSFCPYCGEGKHLLFSEPDFDDGAYYEGITCEMCGSMWTNVYTFSLVVPLEEVDVAV